MKVTIKDIAAACEVSKATVSRYLNGSGYVSKEASDKIKATIEEMNYVPSQTARSLSTRKSKVIGVVVPEANNPFFGEVFKGISDVADQQDLSIIYVDTSNDKDKEFKALAMLRTYDICGLIITVSGHDDEASYMDRLTKLINELNVPVVFFDRRIEGISWPGVYADNVGGAYQGTKLLIDSGHRNIATICGNQSYLLGKNRQDGFIRAIDEAGISTDEVTIMEGDFTKELAYKKTLELIGLPKRPTAIFSPNNLTTIGIVKALYENGLKIPEDMALVGFDDIELFNDLQMPITTLKRDTVKLGEACMDLLNIQMSGKEEEIMSDVIVHPKLIIRGSEKICR